MCGAYNPVVVEQGQASLIPCGLGTKDSCTKTHLSGRASQSKQCRVSGMLEIVEKFSIYTTLMHLGSRSLTKIFNVMACKNLQE